MRISINANIIEGPWGGGNQFVKIFTEHLRKNHLVTFSLEDSDIDLILMIHPNKDLQIINYGIDEIKGYKICHPNTLLVHRVNTSGERGTSSNETEIILKANQEADFTVFISSYLKNFYIGKGFTTDRPHSIIYNGADEKNFNPDGRANWHPCEKLKIVTHHWSNNYMKGFDIYEQLDLLLKIKPFPDLFEFTFIGNIPKGLHFKYTHTIPPLSGLKLAQALKQNHLYLTASRNEAAGMHHIEGMRCGLPVLYLNSGALPEYCSPYGIEFTLINFEQKLLEMREKYSELREKVLECPYTGTSMAKQYLKLFEELVNSRREHPLPNPTIMRKLTYTLFNKPIWKIKQGYELFKKAKRFLKELKND